jgi:2-polyprenyl-3-methyl-5-hydroxy-6-metoxy-1,4-benzoquinol methylase
LKENDLAQFHRQQISEPAFEDCLKGKVQQITPIEDGISKSVRAQYEQNPYPRWRTLPPGGVTSYAKHLEDKIPHLADGTVDLPDHPEVLIAGCGTGRQPISTAKSFPETNLLAVDLSLASISYAQRKAMELKIRNITFAQADITELGTLNRKFDIVECSGVLHHMKDPAAGWRVLTDLLADNGYMLIGLYSEMGRQDIISARQFIQDNNYGDTINDIRHCRKAIMALEDGHPTRQILRHNDFYTTSACRDLIFHVQEHRFTLHQISDLLQSLGLEFLGFQLDRASSGVDYRCQFPDDITQTNLQNWHEFENRNPQTFATMYKFWVRKKSA